MNGNKDIQEEKLEVSEKIRDTTAAKGKNIEEKPKKAGMEENQCGLFALRVLRNQKLILQRNFTRTKTQDRQDVVQKEPLEPELKPAEDLYEQTTVLMNSIEMHSKSMQSLKQEIEILSTSLQDKKMNIEELKLRCELEDKSIREMIESTQRKNLEMKAKLQSLLIKTKTLDENISSVETDIQQINQRFDEIAEKIVEMNTEKE
ncbi:uncharacterized protein LOC132256921 [Phlebotomus argentipes]|uniref:uncharacterized protein LOC132256921 n=1 Tax=Phlebotomus argentipes TaxID=94469 RepID=UPI002892B8D8|nr:uncharacterized protein LOC132256921 [Phlebotomus argentipes]XP_059609513.1 uncharacterized protein LOC132256921 [Phlebotomus argentipes]